MTAWSDGDALRPRARACTLRPTTSLGGGRRALAAGAIVLAVLTAVRTVVAVAATQPALTNAGAASGGPGAQISYQYTWDYADCAATHHPNKLVVFLTWDDSAMTVIAGPAKVTVRAPDVCQGAASGRVPASATAGVHLPSAYLVDTRNNNQRVPNSGVQTSQGFTVILPPTPTPTPAPTPTTTAAPTATPTPTPTDTPLPTDTPTATPSPSPSSSPTNSSAITAGNPGGSTPPGALLLVGVVVVLVIAAATAAAVLVARRRRPQPNKVNDDPFQFLR